MLYDVLYVPEFKYNLISIPKLTKTIKCKLIFDDLHCVIQDMTTLKMIERADVQNCLYVLSQPTKLQAPNQHIINSIIAKKPTVPFFDLWHFRLGHPSILVLQNICKHFPFIKFDSMKVCDYCHLAKQSKLPFPPGIHKSSAPFDLIHIDIWGPLAISSIQGHKYFLTIVDDFTRHTWLFLMKSKHETRILVKNFITLVQTQFNKRIKILRTDNGLEFSMSSIYQDLGIIHQTSCVETPQQNAVVERKHKHILNVTRSLLFHSKLPKSFWSFAVNHAVFFINRLPSPVLNQLSPFQLLYNTKPNLNDLRFFGSLCFASTLQQHRTKLDPRAKKCLFLGFKPGTKGYIVFDLQTREISISRNQQISHEPSPTYQVPSSSHTMPNQSVTTPRPAHSPQQPPPLPLRRSQRIPFPPTYLKDFHCNFLTSSPQLSKGISHPISSVINYNTLSSSHLHYVLSLSTHEEPKFYHQAVKLQEWVVAMKAEIDALTANNTWTIVDLPSGKHPIGCKWVYKIKYRSDGSVERYKARLVAKGFTQTEGLDYFETFAPVAK
uniref:Retrovirus-related Pol polyprotein from transposon TNT 1-94 n=1 Tax=Cajanus cajan TaxID=3821 RepID=A0A151TNJ6_CAJCA|nr:Retrovirus-related Pol polyprotein from transposon TNT 1-94 [Cajanus cajan]